MKQFVLATDRQGNNLIGDSVVLRQEELNPFENHSFVGYEKFFSNWPSERYVTFLMCAQHAGIPTRLLDWSTSVFVAAYFAAREAAEDRQANKQLALWALDTNWSFWYGENGDHRRMILSPPAGLNDNLNAQKGLFTLIKGNNIEELNKCLSKLIHSLEYKHGDEKRVCLYKILLPYSESPKLLRLLTGYGVDGASLFPGAEGIRRFVEEKCLWDKYGI